MFDDSEAVVEDAVLGAVAQHLLHLPPILHRVHPVDRHRASRRLQHAGDHPYRGALPRSIVTEKRGDRPLSKGDIETLERDPGATSGKPILLPQVPDHDPSVFSLSGQVIFLLCRLASSYPTIESADLVWIKQKLEMFHLLRFI